MDNSQLAEHLRFLQELGVTGVSRDPRWRQRLASTAASINDQRPRANGQIQNDQIPNDQIPNRQIPNRQIPNGQIPNGQIPNGQIPNGQIPNDQVPNRQIPSGQIPNGQIPNGQIQNEVAASNSQSVPVARNAAEALAATRADLGDCTRCKLHALGRRQIVFGVGSPTAELMFVGEAPGADEDVKGIPFVGRAGQLLTKMIEAMGYRRDDVYIANVIKCRPPENRNPDPDEVETCEPFLFQQIAAIQPKVIVALGSFAAKTLLRTQSPISRLRGRVYEYHGAKLVPTFHPSYLLRSPGQKREAWDDLKLALTLLGRQPPARGAVQ